MKDFDFIKEKFENENITAPDSLSEDVIMSKLGTGEEPKNVIKLRNKKPFKAVVAMVACFAVFIVSVVSVNAFNDNRNITKEISCDSALITYNDYSEIEAQIKSLEKERTSIFEYGLGYDGLTMKGDALEGVATDVADDSSSINHSVTNAQVEGVDEADIVKTDGKYIYRLNSDDSAIKIFEVNGKKVKKLSFAKADEKHSYAYISEFYLIENKLVAIGFYEDYNKKGTIEKSRTFAYTYNVEDRANPTLEYTYETSGSYTSSRMIGDVLYLITDHYSEKGSYIPTVNDEKIDCDCIYGCPNIDEPRFVVVSAIDIKNQNSSKIKSKAILGGASQVYCSTENLYVLSTNYRWYDMIKANNVNDEKVTSDIIKISLDETKLEIVATAQIEGRINNQYSMNEKDGYFFVASTTENNKHEDINTLYVLDDKLSSVSKVDNFAKNEHIEAVRYVGSYAYVITYEQTDPLFAIDLSDVHSPQIMGSVKIDGFSTSLMPIDENTILGIGYDAEDGRETGLKIVLFDVSNPAKPSVIDEMVYDGVYSPAQYETKAITMFDGKVAIPAYQEGIYLIDYSNNELEEINQFYNEDSDAGSIRAVRINDYLYSINDYNATIDAFKM